MGRVLIVDDDPLCAAMTRQDLLREGHHPWVVDSAAAALGVLGSGSRFDVVVTDLMMPDMDGIELILAIRRLYPALPIIALSSGGERRFLNILGMAHRLGADRVLQKPASATEVGAAIRSLLDRHPGREIPIDGTRAGLESENHGRI
jgi:DNA-binding response OmpR family regulator